ncbi:MAG: TRIC cation channel family protein [Phascolarctobacterium sp.]|nr:TRIC cation channel family protein [Candidatus Phascolarctobacterium caballi]
MENFTNALDIIGTIAFALSGTLAALNKNMHITGIVILSWVAGVGGSILRDLILGVTPPMAFVNPIYSFISIGVGVIIFLFIKIDVQLKYDKQTALCILDLADAVGLSVFLITGIIVAKNIYGQNTFLCLVAGVLTAVGGGFLRDLCICQIPQVFIRSFYISSVIVGGLAYIATWNICKEWQCMLLGAAITFILRMLDIYFHWQVFK